jgi:long-chain acyl-CoA synthetase
MNNPTSVGDMLRQRIATTPSKEAFSRPNGRGGFEPFTWSQVGSIVDKVAAGLIALDINKGDRIALLCSTRVDWLWADLGINCAGAATTTVYPSTPEDGCAYIIQDSGAVGIFCEDDEQVAKILSIREQLPDLRFVVNIDGSTGEDDFVISWSDFIAKGESQLNEAPDCVTEAIASVGPDDLATLIYTSGTTGNPKGVILVHDCWLYVCEVIDSEGIMTTDDKQFLWLPLSHSFGKMLEVIVIRVGMPTAVDGEIPKIIDNLAVVQPTFMAAAPRIFEKVYNKVINGAKEAGGLKYKIFKWALKVGKASSKVMQAGKQPSGLLGLQYRLADKLVFSKLRARFGGRIKFFISGSAPLNRDIAEFFHAAGLIILEGYGLTESSAASFVNRPDANRFGTVGPPLPGTEVKIADDGEILFRSRGVMRGYWNLPEKTAETLLEGGWLRITDRKKDLIKTSGGKYVAPQQLEGSFKAVCPVASQILVHGNARNFCSALITMDPEAIVVWAKENGKSSLSYAALADDPDVNRMFQEYVDQLNSGLASFETIKKFKLLGEDFSVEAGTLTPSLKVKRKAIEQQYKDDLDGFYETSFAAV